MNHRIVPIDPDHYSRADTIAVNNSWRRFFHPSQLGQIAAEFGLDVERIERARDARPGGHVFVIDHGLMRGLYTWHKGVPVSLHIASEADVQPLQAHHGRPTHDVSICHAFAYPGETVPLRASDLAKRLTALGLKTYHIDEDDCPDDPIWTVRYREAVYHSRFFVPILAPTFAEHPGALAELIEMCAIDDSMRHESGLPPIVPLLVDTDADSICRIRGPHQRTDHAETTALSRLRDRTVWWSTADGLDRLAAFLVSLRKLADGTPDLGYLRALAPRLRGFVRTRLDGRPAARIYVADDPAGPPLEMTITATMVQVMGRHDPGNRVDSGADLVNRLGTYLLGPTPVPWTMPTRPLLTSEGHGPNDSWTSHLTLGRQFLALGRRIVARRHFESAIERGGTSGSLMEMFAQCEGVVADRRPWSAGDDPFDPEEGRFTRLSVGARQILSPFTGIGQPASRHAGWDDYEAMLGRAARERRVAETLDIVAAMLSYSVSLKARARLLDQVARWLAQVPGQGDKAQLFARRARLFAG